MTEMDSMFTDANAFNVDLSKWIVTNVITMGSMFGGALTFNQDISKWVSLGSFVGVVT